MPSVLCLFARYESTETRQKVPGEFCSRQKCIINIRATTSTTTSSLFNPYMNRNLKTTICDFSGSWKCHTE